jgi:hypothetical protein
LGKVSGVEAHRKQPVAFDGGRNSFGDEELYNHGMR